MTSAVVTRASAMVPLRSVPDPLHCRLFLFPLLLLLLAAHARGDCPATTSSVSGIAVTSDSSGRSGDCNKSVRNCFAGAAAGGAGSGADGCCYYVNGVRVSPQEAYAAYKRQGSGGSSASSSVNCFSSDGTAAGSSESSTSDGSASAKSSAFAGGGGGAEASSSASAGDISPAPAKSPTPTPKGATGPTASASATAAASAGSPPRATATATASASATRSDSGCIGMSTSCDGTRALDIARSRFAIMHPGQRLERDVLCIRTNSSEVCATPKHIITFDQQSQTMSALCDNHSSACVFRRELVFNYWARNPDEVIECGEFGITQKVDNRVLAAHAWFSRLTGRPETVWLLMRVFNL